MSKAIFKSTLLLSGFVFLAQIFGLVRDLYLARVFGVGQLLDTYYLAFKIPDFLSVFYSVFLGSVIFIPLLTMAKNTSKPPGKAGGVEKGLDNREEVLKKINTVGSLVLVFIVLFSVLLFVFMPQLTNYLAPAWDNSQKELLVNLSRILLFGQFFFPVGILAGCIGMVYGRTLPLAMSGFVYSFCILIFSLILVPTFGIYGLVYSVVLSSICFMLVQIYPSIVRYYLSRFVFKIDFKEWRVFIYKNVGRFFAVLAYQFYSILILAIAALSGAGGVSSFSIAYNIYLAGFFILGASFSTALLPRISELHSRGETATQKKNLKLSIFYTFIVSTIAAIILFYLSIYIIKILYYFSQLSEVQEIYIASLLTLLSFSFPFFNVLEVVRKYLYSTAQIFMAGSITVFLLFSVSSLTYLLNIFSTSNILTSLILSLNISLFVTSVLVLIILKFKNQI